MKYKPGIRIEFSRGEEEGERGTFARTNPFDLPPPP